MINRTSAIWILLGACAIGFITIAPVGSWSFLIPFRLAKLGGLVLVGACLATATVLFQTITANRILTPSVMGFDALYVFVLTGLVHSIGAAGYGAMPPVILFALNLAAMTGLGMVLFGLLMAGGGGDVVRLVLSGIVLGILIRSLAGFLQRMIDPSEFQTVQAASFARFTYVDPALLGLAAVAAIPAMIFAWRMRFRLDVLSLGTDTATGLGENPRRLRWQALVLICLLVGAATALVGPLTSGDAGPSNFFGLIVTALAHIIAPGSPHGRLLPLAAAIGCIILVGGQLVMERLLNLATPLPVVIEIIGGTLFLFLLMKRRSA